MKAINNLTRVILQLCQTAPKTNSHNVEGKNLKFPAIRKHFAIVTGHNKKKIHLDLYLKEKLTNNAKHCQSLTNNAKHLQVNYQSKYNSLPSYFLFLVIEGKQELYAILDFLKPVI